MNDMPKMIVNEEWMNHKWKLAFVSKDGAKILPTSHVFTNIPGHDLVPYEGHEIVVWKKNGDDLLKWINRNALVEWVPKND